MKLQFITHNVKNTSWGISGSIHWCVVGRTAMCICYELRNKAAVRLYYTMENTSRSFSDALLAWFWTDSIIAIFPNFHKCMFHTGGWPSLRSGKEPCSQYTYLWQSLRSLLLNSHSQSHHGVSQGNLNVSEARICKKKIFSSHSQLLECATQTCSCSKCFFTFLIACL